MRPERQIYLVGFMGSGKSTVGPPLALALGRPFHDLDRLVEAAGGNRITKIFERLGESGFRRLETERLRRIAAAEPSVIAVGGGAFHQEANRRLMKRTGVTVWLQVSLETARERALGDRDRPLARDPAAFRRLFEERLRIYGEADLHVPAEGKTPDQVRDDVIEALVRADIKPATSLRNDPPAT